MDKQEFDAYLARMEVFRGRMDELANSIELMLVFILKVIGIKLGRKEMLGSKISKFERSQETLESKYSGDFGGLVDKLRKFNENWVITKHGITVGGQGVSGPEDLTFHKDNKCHTFDPKRQEEIVQEFTKIMGALIEISKGI